MATSSVLQDPRISAGMRAQFALRQRQREAGARQIGWKVGMGIEAAKERLRITAPLVGFLMNNAVLSSGASLSVAGWKKPWAEPEIAVTIGHALPPGASRQTARSAIASIGPAIELVDLGPADDVQAILAGNIFQRHVIFGPTDMSRSGGLLDGLTGRVTRSGADVPVPPDLETNIGEIIGIIQHVANVTAALGDGLRAGQVVICGSLTPPLVLEPADTGVEFALDPIGAVSLRFG